MSDNTDVDFRPFDADNHYYETHDTFTRHIPPAWRARTVEIAEIDGRVRHIVGGRINRLVTNPTFDPIVKPGCLYGYFRSNPERRPISDFMKDREPIPAHYHDRDARIEYMDGQGLGAVWMFPTLGVLYEEELKQDPEAVKVTFRAFNRWLNEDWGVNYKNRIYGAPYIPLVDVDWAVEELEWALNEGARLVCMRPAAPWTVEGPRAPGDPIFDPFWARVNETGITVAVHGGNSGFGTNGYEDGREVRAIERSPLRSIMIAERPIRDFLTSLACTQLFTRFPNLRIASIENGAGYVPEFLKKLDRAQRQHVGYFTEDAVEAFREHVWINPFWEDNIDQVLGCMGADHVLFGSDWPHAEGLVDPLDYLADIKHLDRSDQDRIMQANTVELTALRPA